MSYVSVMDSAKNVRCS